MSDPIPAPAPVVAAPAAPAVAAADPAAATPFYLDKGLYVAVLTPLFLILNQKFGLSLDATTIVAIILPAVGYILGHKFKSAQVQVAAIKAGADAATADAAATLAAGNK